jgi:dolichol-phosphate mannosyltransferase
MYFGIDDAVLIPVYNEGESVLAVLDSVRVVHQREIIVVDDGSTDETQEALMERDDVLVVRHPENMGYGRSLIDGFAFANLAGIRNLITMDCDGQHEPAHIPEFFAALAEGDHDIVSGSRYLPESDVVGKAPPDRQEVNAQVTETINSATGWDITDAFCGFKAYRLEKIMGLGLSEQGYGMPLELWAKAYRAGLRVRELPVERIYFDHDRTFGEDLDDAEARLAYYRRVWEEALGEEG